MSLNAAYDREYYTTLNNVRVVGKVTPQQLMALRHRGLTPKQALDALTDEAKRRHPGVGCVIIQPSSEGFDILALP